MSKVSRRLAGNGAGTLSGCRISDTFTRWSALFTRADHRLPAANPAGLVSENESGIHPHRMDRKSFMQPCHYRSCTKVAQGGGLLHNRTASDLNWFGPPCEARFWDWKLGPAEGRVEAGCCQAAPLSEPYLKVSLHTAQTAPTGAPCAGTRRQPSDVRNDFGLPGEGRGHWGVRTSAEHAPCKASALREVFGVA